MKKSYIYLFGILLLAFFLRLFFFTGHIFSDDSYYTHLSYTLLNGTFAEDYFGYPVSPLRINHISTTSLSFFAFGISETSSIIFPFILSLLNIPLTYLLTKQLKGNVKAALIACFIFAIFPVDTVFASINFVDLQAVFFINLGIYFTIKAQMESRIYYAVPGGLSFFISIQFKEVIYYYFILMLILSIVFYFKDRSSLKYICIPLIFIAGNILVEGFIYYLINHSFFYRLKITELNYIYAYYNFFPYSVSETNFLSAFIKQVLNNIKNVFFRRFYLLLPLVAFFSSVLFLKRKENKFLTFWFLGLAVLLIAFTTSFSSFKLLDLRNSWYVYPLFMPAILLSTLLLNKLKKKLLITALMIMILFSLYMCNEYQKFFAANDLKSFKEFLINNDDKNFYSSHLTYYGINLIQGYKNYDSGKIINSKDFELEKIIQGDLLVINSKHNNELELQGYSFPSFESEMSSFKLRAKFGDYEIYEKIF